MTLGKSIQQLRLEKKYSQRKLALLSNVSNTTISRIESDSVTPDIDTISKIAAALKTDLSTFLPYIDSNLQAKSSPQSNSNMLTLSQEEKKDVAEGLEKFKKELAKHEQNTFDGEPLTDEARQSIISAIEMGLALARQKNSEKI